MQWLNSEQGKSRAMNLALYNSEGKYIINLDSDGILEKNALTNLVDVFENDLSLNVMTGTILTQPELIEASVCTEAGIYGVCPGVSGRKKLRFHDKRSIYSVRGFFRLPETGDVKVQNVQYGYYL